MYFYGLIVDSLVLRQIQLLPAQMHQPCRRHPLLLLL